MPISDVRLNIGQGRQTQEAALAAPGVTFIGKFDPPMQVEIIATREPARVTFLADVVGYSLAEWCIGGGDGEQGFVSVDKLRVRDSNYLPAATPRT